MGSGFLFRPVFGCRGECIELFFDPLSMQFQLSAVELCGNLDTRSYDGSSSTARSWDGKLVPATAITPGAIAAEANGDDGNLQATRKINTALCQMPTWATWTIGRNGQVHPLTAMEQFLERGRATAIRRTADGFQASELGHMRQNLGILVLAQQHRQPAIGSQVNRKENVFMPKYEDYRADKMHVGRVCGSIVTVHAITEGRHQTIDRLDHGQTEQSPENRRRLQRAKFLACCDRELGHGDPSVRSKWSWAGMFQRVERLDAAHLNKATRH